MQHQFWAAVAISWIFSAAVSSMPDPGNNANPVYLWLYRFLHTIAGNVTTAFGSKIPGLKTLACLLAALLSFSLSACAAHYAIHPGALNTTDSAAYDTLLVAEGAIDQARIDLQQGQLPAAAKPPLDALILAYNTARQSWLTYRGAIATNVPSAEYFTELSTNLSNLAAAIRAFEEVK